MGTTEYTVTGMTCGNCERHVREEVEQLAGVTAVEVSHTSGRLAVTTSGDTIADTDVIAAVAEAGYTAARV